MNKAERFFYDNAGYSYASKETKETEREASARRLALAEAWVTSEGYCFRWEIDALIDSSDFSNEDPPWGLWECSMHEPDNGEIVEYLGGIDFGRDGSPYGENYRRVVEAELAIQHMNQ